MKKTGFWLGIIGILLAVCIAAALLVGGRGGMETAEILLDGELYAAVDLRKDQTFTVTSEWGSNTVIVEHGAVRVEEATCPDHVCIRQGACSGGTPIVCLPNRLVIQFPVSDGVDGSAG